MKLKNSISNLISVSIFFSIFLMGAVFFLGYYYYSKIEDSENFIKGVDTRVEHLSSSIADNLWNLDKTTIERILEVFYSSPNVIKINLLSEDMNIVLPEKEGNKEYFHKIKKSVVFLNNRSNNKTVESIGTIEVVFSDEAESVKNKKFLTIMFFALIGTVVVVIIILKVVLNKFIVKPFSAFTYGFKKIADGDYDYISKLEEGEDLKFEFIPLLSSLSKMSIDIKDQMSKREEVQQELIEAGKQLEAKVITRTEELNKTKNELVTISREAGRAEFATDVIHNIGNALNSININTDTLRSQMKDLQIPVIKKITELFEINKDNLEKLITKDSVGKKIPDIINQFYEYLKEVQKLTIKDLKEIKKDIQHIQNIIANQQSHAKNILVMEVYSPIEIMDEAIRMNRRTMGRYNISITKKYSAVSDIKTDKHKLLQVLTNLVSNAKQSFEKQNRENRNITCFIRKQNYILEFEVKDNGIGIYKENITKIFTHGFTTRKDGHGFGLHNSANNVKQLDGELLVRSDGIGKGASFIVKIPY